MEREPLAVIATSIIIMATVMVMVTWTIISIISATIIITVMIMMTRRRTRVAVGGNIGGAMYVPIPAGVQGYRRCWHGTCTFTFAHSKSPSSRSYYSRLRNLSQFHIPAS